MSEGSIDTKRHAEAISGLLEFHSEKRFAEAMADPNGTVPVEVVVDHVDILERLHAQEIDELGRKLASFESLDVTMGRYEELLNRLKILVEAQARIAPGLAGVVADMEASVNELYK